MSQDTPRVEGPLGQVIEIMARLRGPGGCPWDREQDHRSLRPCLLEEAYEVLEATDAGDDEALRQELGDLLLQVIFHAQLAAEEGRFDIHGVAAALRDKLIARHPHVFGEASARTAGEVLEQWERLKGLEMTEEGQTRAQGPPKAMPALARAQAVRARQARTGGGRPAAEAVSAARRALDQMEGPGPPGQAETALGELLLAAVDLACARGVDAEQLLRERVTALLT